MTIRSLCLLLATGAMSCSSSGSPSGADAGPRQGEDSGHDGATAPRDAAGDALGSTDGHTALDATTPDAVASDGGSRADAHAGDAHAGDALAGDAHKGDAGAAMRLGMNPGPGGTVASTMVYGSFNKELNVTAVRLFFPVYTYDLPATTDDSGPYYFADNFTEIVNRIDGYYAQGFRVTLTISGSYCGGTPTCPPFPSTLTTTRPDGSFQTQFDTYMAALITDLGSTFDKVSSVEIWNEWDDQYGYTTSTGTSVWSASQYVDALLKGGYAAVKAARPSVEVLAGAVVMNHESDIGALVTAGAAPFADGFSYHPYYSATTDLQNGLAKATSYIPSGKSLFLTEWGCNEATLATRATNLTASFPVLRAGGVEEADYYVLLTTGTDETTFGLLNGDLTGNGASAGIVDAGPRSPLFAAFQTGAQ